MASGLPSLNLSKFSTTARRSTDQIRLSKLNKRRKRVLATRICQQLTYMVVKIIHSFFPVEKCPSFVFVLSASNIRICFFTFFIFLAKLSNYTLVNIMLAF